MAFHYLPSPPGGELRQGEILADVFEYRCVGPPILPGAPEALAAVTVHHCRVVVLTADCDLLQDHQSRGKYTLAERQGMFDYEENATLAYVTLADLFEEGEIRERREARMNKDLWRRVQQNQNERYHHLDEGYILRTLEEIEAGKQGETLPDVYLDFRKALAIPAEAIYRGIEAGVITRVGCLPPIWVHDVMHRFYGYLSRVMTPDP